MYRYTERVSPYHPASTEELRRLAEAAAKGEAALEAKAALETSLAEKTAALDRATAAEAAAAARSAREASSFEQWRLRARSLLDEKDAEIDKLRKRFFGDGPGSESARGTTDAALEEATASVTEASSSGGGGVDGANGKLLANPPKMGLPDADITYLRSVVLKFLEAPDWSTQQQLLPVLAMLLRVSPAEFKRVNEARQDMEPTPLHMAEVAIAKQIPGVTNSITTTLGLGNFF